jgi:hypothetical protein
MAATALIRATLKRALYDLIVQEAPARADGSGPIQVLYGPNVRDLEDEVIWFGAVEGAVSYPVLAGGAPRVHRQDEFTMDVWIGVRSPIHADDDSDAGPFSAADTQWEAMAAAVDTAVAQSPGLTGDRLAHLDGVIHVLLEAVDGPAALDLSESGLGVWSAVGRIRVQFTTRIT